MAFEGYRLKINGVVYPNSNMQRGSYSITEQKRVVEIWTDANLVEHEITTGVTKAVISFAIRQHDGEEHDAIVNALKPENGLQIEYWSDLHGEYKTGVFRRSDVAFRHRNVIGSNVVYDAAQVTLTED